MPLLVSLFLVQMLCGSLWVSTASADRVFLQTGDLIEGIVVNQTTESVNVQIDSSSYVMFSRREIERIEPASKADNQKIMERWEADRRKSGNEESKGGGGWFRSLGSWRLPWSDVEHGFMHGLGKMHEQIHVTLTNFPITGFFLNLDFISNYRRKQPELYILGFYSFWLLVITLSLQSIYHKILNIFTAIREKRARRDIPS